MDTRTGAIRELAHGEQLSPIDEVRARLDADPDAPIPEEVEVPPSYLDLSPAQRLAFAFGSINGKDRKAARTPPKSDRQRRHERAELRHRRQARKRP